MTLDKNMKQHLNIIFSVILIFLFVAFEFIIAAFSFGIRLFYTNGNTFKDAVSDHGLKLFFALLLFSAFLHIPAFVFTVVEYFLKKEASFAMLIILSISLVILAYVMFCMEG